MVVGVEDFSLVANGHGCVTQGGAGSEGLPGNLSLAHAAGCDLIFRIKV